MLRKNSRIAFGGMWVFPGGRIDPGDFEDDGDLEHAARNAAAREAEEEANVTLKPDEFVWFSHWTPPADVEVRFATWFFVARASGESKIQVDGGEIEEHMWLNAQDALRRHANKEIDLAPPTWVTLFQLTQHSDVDSLLAHYSTREAEFFATRIASGDDGVRVAMWHGDSGYETTDAGKEGCRHRLVMRDNEYEYIRS